MIDLKKLRNVAESQNTNMFVCSKQEAIQLLDQLEAAQADAARIDWLESSTEHHGFCGIGYGEYRHYAFQESGYASVRQVIDAAMDVKNKETT